MSLPALPALAYTAAGWAWAGLTHHDELLVLLLDVAAVEGAVRAARVRKIEARLADAQVRAATEAEARYGRALQQSERLGTMRYSG